MRTIPHAAHIVAAANVKSQHTIVPPRERLFPAFGRAAKAIWPRKTAAHLAAQAHVTERAAKHWIYGQREPSAAAIQAIVNAMLEEKRVDNRARRAAA